MVLAIAPAGKRGLLRQSQVEPAFARPGHLVRGLHGGDNDAGGLVPWRAGVPFLVSILLVGAAPSCGACIPETPASRSWYARQALSPSPFVEAVGNPRPFLIALGLKLSGVSGLHAHGTVVGYATTQLKLPRKRMLDAVFWAALIEVAMILLFG